MTTRLALVLFLDRKTPSKSHTYPNIAWKGAENISTQCVYECKDKNTCYLHNKHRKVCLRVIDWVCIASIISKLPHNIPGMVFLIFQDTFRCVFHAICRNDGGFICYVRGLKHTLG